MNKADITQELAHQFLENHFGYEPINLSLVGEGGWSRCYGFTHKGQALVVKFGPHADDFYKDQHAYRYRAAALPVPQVLEIGEAFGGYFAIAERAYGAPLEQVNAAEWEALVPRVADMLEVLRTAALPANVGGGGWDRTGRASNTDWADYLLDIAQETENEWLGQWRAKLATSTVGEEAFVWGIDQLKQFDDLSEVPLSLIHGDLINRNVFVQEGKITAVFDWGCGLYGDHLYELAWFEFWASWYPEKDFSLLRHELERRWEAAGYWPEDMERRLTAAYLRIGLDHFAYNAFIDDWPALEATAERMYALTKKS